MKFGTVLLEFDKEKSTLWCYHADKMKPFVSERFLDDLLKTIKFLEDEHFIMEGIKIKFFVLASKNSVYNLGGDLDLFIKSIKKKDRETLSVYGKKCIDSFVFQKRLIENNIISISLIEGNAYGGGLEMGLSSQIVAAKQDVRLGFPEINFNMFPGMGAFSILNRRVLEMDAKNILLSGKLFQAEQFHEMKVIDHIFEENGKAFVNELIEDIDKKFNGYLAIHRFFEKYHNPPTQELYEIVEDWVEFCLNVNEADINLMDSLVKQQKRKFVKKMITAPFKKIMG